MGDARPGSDTLGRHIAAFGQNGFEYRRTNSRVMNRPRPPLWSGPGRGRPKADGASGPETPGEGRASRGHGRRYRNH